MKTPANLGAAFVQSTKPNRIADWRERNVNRLQLSAAPFVRYRFFYAVFNIFLMSLPSTIAFLKSLKPKAIATFSTF